MTDIAGSSKRQHVRSTAAVTIGNVLEWYDFSVYIIFAPLIAAAFFPGENETASLINALLVFGVGFLARPMGALLIGRYADRAGRKAALMLTFSLMAIGTLVIAITPTHVQIGAAAPILILLGRLLQGLSAGGEIGGAAVFLVEHAPAERKASIASWLQASMGLSNILGTLVALAVGQMLSADALAAWGWRVPFLLGLAIVPVGIWLRRSIGETPEFLALQPERKPGRGMLAGLRGQKANLARGFCLSVLWGVCVYALIIFMPVYFQTRLGFDRSQAFLAALFGNVMLIAASFVSGRIADRIGERRLMGFSAMALLAIPPIAMAALDSVHGLAMLIVVHGCFGALVGLYSGAIPAVLVRLFPVHIRSTAMAIVYNGAVTIFAGFAPALISALGATVIGVQAPTLYTSLAALAALAAIVTLPDRRS